MAKKRGNGEGSIIKRADGTWTARKMYGYKPNGKPNIVAFYAGTRAEVKKKLDDYQKRYDAGKQLGNGQRMCFGDYYADWMIRYKKNSVKPTTYDALEYTLTSRIRPYPILCNAQMHQLNTRLLQEYFNQLADSGEYALSTIKRTKSNLNDCLNKAVVMGNIQTNPLTGVELPKEDKLAKKKKKIDALSDTDVHKIVKEAMSKRTERGTEDQLLNRYRYGYHIEFLLYSGLRAGEAVALLWSDVDFDKGVITVNKNMSAAYLRDNDGQRVSRELIQGTPKSNSGTREVPLLKEARHALMEIRERNKRSDPNDLIFQTATMKPVDQRDLRRTLNAMQKNAGTDSQNSGLHVLRHTFASMLFQKNIDIKIISEWLGHANVRITYDTYITLTKKHAYNVAEILNTLDAPQLLEAV